MHILKENLFKIQRLLFKVWVIYKEYLINQCDEIRQEYIKSRPYQHKSENYKLSENEKHPQIYIYIYFGKVLMVRILANNKCCLLFSKLSH